MEYRVLGPDWAGRLAALERRCFTVPWTEGMFREELENPMALLWGCVEGEELLGYLGLQWILDQGEILSVAVLPPARRRGIGRGLLELALEECGSRNLASVTLEVRAGNMPAQRLYESYGFVPVGRRKNYYTLPREDAILMTLEFEHGTEAAGSM